MMELLEIMSNDASLLAYSNAKTDTNTDVTHTNPQKYHKVSIQKNTNIQLGHAPNYGPYKCPEWK